MQDSWDLEIHVVERWLASEWARHYFFWNAGLVRPRWQARPFLQPFFAAQEIIKSRKERFVIDLSSLLCLWQDINIRSTSVGFVTNLFLNNFFFHSSSKKIPWTWKLLLSMSVHAESLLGRSNSEPDMLSTAKKCQECYFPGSVHAQSLLERSNSEPDIVSTAKQSMTGEGAVCPASTVIFWCFCFGRRFSTR
jgi:hypothetical protein